MRWRFADSSNKEEAEYSRLMLEKIDSFWQSFQQKSNVFLLPETDINEKVEWTSAELAKVSDQLSFEFAPEENAGLRFAITPDCSYHLHPLLETMLERAPVLPGIRIIGHREAVVPEHVAGLVKARSGAWLDDILISARISDKNAVDLTFYSDQFSSDKQADIEYCALLIEVLFGQIFFEQWTGIIETCPRTASLAKRVGSLFGKSKEKVPADSCSIEDAPALIQSLKQSIIDKLPARPL